MSYLNSVTLVGFVGVDPEQRQARNNGSKFTVLSVAAQRSWKNAQDDEGREDYIVVDSRRRRAQARSRRARTRSKYFGFRCSE